MHLAGCRECQQGRGRLLAVHCLVLVLHCVNDVCASVAGRWRLQQLFRKQLRHVVFPSAQALHDGAARNKTFEVCSEVAAEPGQAAYELVAHLPDRSNNYLTPALVTLEKNT